MEQMKKGAKPPLFIDNPQGHPASREPRMIETGGKYQGRHLFNVGVVGEIICLEIVLAEVIK
jgi:hypothetical protein